MTITRDGFYAGQKGAPIKLPCRVATTGDISSLSGLLTIDTITVSEGDRVLVWQQVVPSQNNIYIASAGAWAIAIDTSLDDDKYLGFKVFIYDGSLYKQKDFSTTEVSPLMFQEIISRVEGDIVLAEGTSIVFDKDISIDESWTGVSIDGTAGTTLAVGNLCYLDSAAGEWVLADADVAATSGPVILGLCILASTNGLPTKLLLNGTIRSAAFPASIALGVPLYVSPTPGVITITAPSTALQIVRIVGWAVTVEPNTIYFAPDTTWLEI
jgi:hypothetical protein